MTAVNSRAQEARRRRNQAKRFRATRLALLVVLLALSTALGILHQYAATARPVGVDALDPFGGIESAITLATTGALVEKIGWTSFVLLGATLLVAVLFRRAFCGKICAFGALQELFGKLGRKLFKRRFTVPARIDRPARYLKYLALAAIVILTAATGELVIRPYDPWAAYHHLFSAELISGFLVGLIVLVLSVAGSLFYDRFFCKYLCPMGAFLGLINRIGLYRVARNNDTCTHCMACDKACPVNLRVESVAQVQSSECINCNLCVAACPVENTLVVAAPWQRSAVLAYSAPAPQPEATAVEGSTPVPAARGIRGISPGLVMWTSVLIFAAVIGVTTLSGGVDWTVKSLQRNVEEKAALDPADIKGTDTFKQVADLSGIPKEEFVRRFGLTEEAFAAPIKESAHGAGATFDTATVRDFVAERMGKPAE